MLLVAVVLLVAVAVNPPVVLFVLSMVYIAWALAEWVLTFRKRRVKMRPQA